jgi:ComF family protein
MIFNSFILFHMAFWTNLVNLIYPNSCLGCDTILIEGEDQICSSCLSNLPYTGFENGPMNHATAIKFYGKIPSTEIYCLLKYRKGNLTQKLIYQFKYNSKKNLGGVFSELQHLRFKRYGVSLDWDIIIPVPLHRSKLQKRGFNQSEIYAQQLSQKTNIPLVNNALVRKVQALLNRETRYENVKSIYEIGKNESILGKSVLLVDDVITTGATLEVCTNLLLENGASRVSIASIATAIYS